MRNNTAAGEDSAETRKAETLEKVAGLSIAQPEKGYRYGLEPFLLFHFVHPRLREKVVDLGTGCGIIALLLANAWPTLRLWGVELQRELADVADRNVDRNALGHRCAILQADARKIKDFLPRGGFKRIVSNPPFRAADTGRISPEPQRALARQELSLTMADLARVSSFLLGHGGGLDFIHLPERLPEIFRTLCEHGLEPKRLKLVHSFRSAGPEQALISARKGGRPGLQVLPPLTIFHSPGRYTKEARVILSGHRRPNASLSSQKHG